MVDGVGAEARPFLDHAPAPEGDGEVLVILADGKGAPELHAKILQVHLCVAEKVADAREERARGASARRGSCPQHVRWSLPLRRLRR